MADRLTQLQDCLDQLLAQMYATIRYIDTRHAYAHIPGQADQFAGPPPTSADPSQPTQQPASSAPAAAPTPADAGAPPPPAGGDGGGQEPTSKDPAPDAPALFAARLRELAQDLVVKEQQAEALADGLPGVGGGGGRARQEARLRELAARLAALDGEAAAWEARREVLERRVEGWIADGVRRV
jgi:mediator of RNA polymerase II transcription subunit 21